MPLPPVASGTDIPSAGKSGGIKGFFSKLGPKARKTGSSMAKPEAPAAPAVPAPFDEVASVPPAGIPLTGTSGFPGEMLAEPNAAADVAEIAADQQLGDLDVTDISVVRQD